jgi:hypothetical protein
MDAFEPKDRHQAPEPVSGRAPVAARAAARRVAAARFVRSAREAEAPAARRVDPVGVPSDPSPPPISVQRGPVLTAAAAPTRGSIPRRIVAAPALSPAGSRWHHEQKCVDLAPTTIRRTGLPHRKHGSPARW